ncbi:hypothetical protein [Antiquaquibacter soli]|uniref:DUF4337 domain-containing protein n=1 Tax=Antiquaquibacter soli TaxID=3064523 RepID=A0ABT9BIQ2_9MICO|nr:hypothetical protein [Protaetiibacter sp. WY-16]MDO7880904.1 hypothetical protein [Protaetiibacter sp. WY-16]
MSTAAPEKQSFLHTHIELIVAVLLGLVSIAVAYATFQGALWDGKMTQQYTIGSNLSTEAESLYLEANQQYVQDGQLLSRLTELELDAAAGVPGAQEKYDTLVFQYVSPELQAAIDWADEQNEADPEFWYDPQSNEDYQAALFGSYAETKDQATATIADGDVANTHSDNLTLYTVLMAISLFLLGVAAVVRNQRTTIMLAGVATVIFVVCLVLTLMIPFIGIG